VYFFSMLMASYLPFSSGTGCFCRSHDLIRTFSPDGSWNSKFVPNRFHQIPGDRALTHSEHRKGYSCECDSSYILKTLLWTFWMCIYILSIFHSHSWPQVTTLNE
jgi:hypothetical protein